MARRAVSALKSWEYPKKSGIRIREILNATKGKGFGGSFLVTVPARITGRLRQRKQFAERLEAEEHADSVFRGFKQQGRDFFALTEAERRDVAAVMPKLRESGITIGDAARFALARMRPAGAGKRVADVVEELRASKQQRFERGDLRRPSLRDFLTRTNRLIEAMGNRAVGEVTGAEIKAWLIGLKLEPRNTFNLLRVVSEVFKFAHQRRYIADNPLDELARVDRKEIIGLAAEAKEPAILTVDQATRLLASARETNSVLHLLPAVVLGLFCGLRTEECKRIAWESVHLADTPPLVTVDRAIAKKRRIRHVTIPDNAVAWLTLCPERKGKLTGEDPTEDGFHRRFRKLIQHAGFGRNVKGKWVTEWESNAMRHSFGSYHYALHGDSLETSRLLGHKASDQVLFDHYRALAGKAQAEAYFAIRPPASTGKLIKFARA
jgi:site-specific recombinase XerC